MKIMLGFEVDFNWEMKQVQSAMLKNFMHEAPSMQPHITLKIPVEIESLQDDSYLNMGSACDELAQKVATFTGNLKGFSMFGSHVVFADVELTQELDDFFNTLNTHLTDWGFKLQEFEINRKPHVTLATNFGSNTDKAGKMVKWLEQQDYLEANKAGIPIEFSKITMFGKNKGELWQPMTEFPFNG